MKVTGVSDGSLGLDIGCGWSLPDVASSLYLLKMERIHLRRIMSADVSDGVLVDVCDADLSALLAQPLRDHLETALDKILASGADTYNGFTNFI